MEIKISTQQILKILYIFSWVIFIGVCIEAGGIIFNAVLSLVLHPGNTQFLWKEVDLTNLLNYDRGYFFVETLLMSIVAVFRAILLYLIVKVLHDKKLNMAQPFTKAIGQFILNVSYLAFGIGMFSFWGVHYTEWLVQKGIQMPDF